METLEFGNPTTSLLLTLAVTGAGVLLAALVYVLLTGFTVRFSARRTLAFALCSILPVLAAVVGYYGYLASFHELDIRDGEIRLRYFYPTREVSVTKDRLARVERRKEGGRTGTTYNLVVTTSDGATYVSANARLQDVTPAVARLQAWKAEP